MEVGVRIHSRWSIMLMCSDCLLPCRHHSVVLCMSAL